MRYFTDMGQDVSAYVAGLEAKVKQLSTVKEEAPPTKPIKKK
jgi:hypothetical protein